MSPQYDVCIIGASIAGSSLALRVGREGLKVALIDKAQFPRRKACGEGLSAIGRNCLEELGLISQVKQAPHTQKGAVLARCQAQYLA